MRFLSKGFSFRSRLTWVVLAVLLVAGGIFALAVKSPETIRNALLRITDRAALIAQFLPATLPKPGEVKEAHWLYQNWNDADRYWFHHATQGTATFPVRYVWFLALERPELSFFGNPGKLSDPDFLRRLGFISSPSTASFPSDAARYGYRSAEGREDKDARRGPGPSGNPAGLPVGFALLREAKDPVNGRQIPDQIGFTCAACHTGHFEYNNVSIRFDGGPAIINLGELERAVGLSLGYTLRIPLRFSRFASEVERISGTSVERDQLKAELEQALAKIVTEKRTGDSVLRRRGHTHVEEGFGRLDALNRIGNQVFYANLLEQKVSPTDLPQALLDQNFVRHDAPVSFPPIWTTPWFLWAQYDASVFNELVRNAGEALGVKAKINLTVNAPDTPLFGSTMNIANIFWLEEMLRGPQGAAGAPPKQFQGLAAPKWEKAAEIFPADPKWRIDKKKRDLGRELYRQHCVECHRGPVNDLDFDKAWKQDSFWEQTGSDRKPNWIKSGDRFYFNVQQKSVAVIGTDPQQALVLTQRRVNLPAYFGNTVDHLNKKGECALPLDVSGNTPFVLALMAVVDKSIDQWFTANSTPVELRKAMTGPRQNCQNNRVFRAMNLLDAEATKMSAVHLVPEPHYRARPLDGVWATAPYLHNGSVPTLHDMLLPQNKRPRMFCVGDHQFDPEKVGLKSVEGTCLPGVTRFDTTQLGNSNLGHSFEGTEKDKQKYPFGIIGPELSQDERSALLEYLKLL